MADATHEYTMLGYYRSWGSQLGYGLLLGGTRHFGFYLPGQSRWAFRRAILQMEDQLASALDLPAGSRVLDAGCGLGYVACRLAEEYGFFVTGVDLDEVSVAKAGRRAVRRQVKGVSFQQGDYTDLSAFADGFFDGLYTMETFVHAAEPSAALSEMFRVLRPGGRLVMHEYSHHPYDGTWVEGERRLRQVNALAAMPAWDLFEHGVLERMVREAGFAYVSERNISEHMLPMLSAFSTIAAVPYRLGRMAGIPDERHVNVLAAAEGWKYRDFARYNILSATKPYGG